MGHPHETTPLATYPGQPQPLLWPEDHAAEQPRSDVERGEIDIIGTRLRNFFFVTRGETIPTSVPVFDLVERLISDYQETRN